MLEKVFRVIVAFKRRVGKVFKKRSPVAKFKARLYYKKHKAKLRISRKRYINRNKMFLKSRKRTKRVKPHVTKAKKFKTPKPHFHKAKKPTVRKFHAPPRAKKPKKP